MEGNANHEKHAAATPADALEKYKKLDGVTPQDLAQL